eukprot:tig00020538_g10350.t1
MLVRRATALARGAVAGPSRLAPVRSAVPALALAIRDPRPASARLDPPAPSGQEEVPGVVGAPYVRITPNMEQWPLWLEARAKMDQFLEENPKIKAGLGLKEVSVEQIAAGYIPEHLAEQYYEDIGRAKPKWLVERSEKVQKFIEENKDKPKVSPAEAAEKARAEWAGRKRGMPPPKGEKKVRPGKDGKEPWTWSRYNKLKKEQKAEERRALAVREGRAAAASQEAA